MLISSDLLIIQDSRGGKKPKPENTSGHDYPSGGYIKVQGTRKLNCPATVQVRAVRLYTDYTLALEEYSSKKSLRKAKASILQELKNDMHSLHPKIASKISELVSENITNADVVRKCLEQYVVKEMFGGHAANQKPTRSNRRYYPRARFTRSHCQSSKCQQILQR